ncbi:kielin/chordin-like protein [Amphiura filiformis]|uniref:kielin/chordin-like protein n=1 Tax=Amphiura filiformis TaxID=82378 RepID=UPI003B20CCB0
MGLHHMHYSSEICLERDGVVTINQNRVFLPQNLPEGVHIYVGRGGKVIVRTDFGLEVSWNGVYNVDVCLPAEYQGKTCGLCGNYNNNPNDDNSNPEGQLLSNDNEFGNSWMTNPGECIEEPSTPYRPCDDEDKLNQAIALCGIITGPNRPCPPGWQGFGSKCYLFLANQPQTWDRAYETCQEENGNLLEIESMEENNYVTEVLQDLPGNGIAWLGCRDQDEEGTWTCHVDNPGHSWLAPVGADTSMGYFSCGEFD